MWTGKERDREKFRVGSIQIFGNDSFYLCYVRLHFMHSTVSDRSSTNFLQQIELYFIKYQFPTIFTN